MIAPTREELLDAVERALEARDMPAVAELVRALALVSPTDAQAILDALALAGGAS
jgi:SOS-response transcriptional repressor LexA